PSCAAAPSATSIACISASMISTLRTGAPPPSRSRSTVAVRPSGASKSRSEEHTSELQSRFDLVCRLLLEKKKKKKNKHFGRRHHNQVQPHRAHVHPYNIRLLGEGRRLARYNLRL